MKKTYTVLVRKADGTMLSRGVLADDLATAPTLTSPCPAVISAVLAALHAADAGAEVINVNCVGAIDVDATASS
jgi:hypothetical protein